MLEIKSLKSEIARNILRSIKLEKAVKKESDVLNSAIGMVFRDGSDGEEVLLGTSTADDDRAGKLCFPGGGIEIDERADKAAQREVWEEAGIKTEIDSKRARIFDTKLPKIVFIHLNYKSGTIKHNDEFSDMVWYSLEQLPAEKMLKNNIEILMKFYNGNGKRVVKE